MQFTEIPSDNRSPLVAAEIDATQSGASSDDPKHAVLIGHRAVDGTAAPNTLLPIGTVAEADALFGAGSQLARMVRAFRDANEDALVSAIGVTGGGATAEATVTFTGPATAEGAISLFVDGQRIVVSIASGATATEIGVAVEAALDADSQLSCLASAAAGVVTLAAKWAGPSGNDLSVSVEASTLPAGVGVDVVDFAGGSSAPTLDGAVAALDEEPYDLVSGLSDAVSLSTLAAEIRRRWDATAELDGHVFAAVKSSISGALSFGATRNDEEVTLIGTLNSPSPPHLWAAALAGAEMAGSDPAAPRDGTELPEVIVAPEKSERANHSQRNQLLRSGISTFRVDASGVVTLDRLITTYQTTSQGDADTTWLALTTRRTVSYLRGNWTARQRRKYAGFKVANDGTRIAPGQKIATPATIKAEALAWFRDMEDAGLVENGDEFKRRLSSVRDQPERIASLLTPDLVNELVTLATRLAFRK